MTTETVLEVMGPRFSIVATDGARALKELNLTPGAAVLDVGTGSGNFAIFMASEGFEVTTGEPATDESMYARRDWAESARRVGVLDRIQFRSFDASDLPFESGTFEGVFFFGVLHHVPEHLRAKAMSEALRVVKQDGAVVLFEPRAEMLEKVRVDDPGHPPAANPSDYLQGVSVREQKVAGSMLDIYIYRKVE